MENFALIGAAGYIAPRHIKAIEDTGNRLVVAYDRFDSVGRLDCSFPDAWFFTRQEPFHSFCRNQMKEDSPLGWTSICTPNHTHARFIESGLRLGTDVICEKPVALHTKTIDRLMKVEDATGHKAYGIMQLRLHKAVADLKKKIENGPNDKIYDVDLTYITSRGKWFYASWKGDMQKSGGIATNIGVHFYDMLLWVFGPVKKNIINVISFDRVAGYLELEKARVRYFLSINADNLPLSAIREGKRTYRILRIDSDRFDFSQGFADLHTESYRDILSGKGLRISETRQCIEILEQIRTSAPVGLVGDFHPLAKLPQAKHPLGWDEKN